MAPTPAEPQSSPSNVSLVIQQTIRPDAVARYEAWLHEIGTKAATYPGHQGLHIIRPAAGATTYTVVIRFATIEDAARWTNSEDRRVLTAQIADAFLETEQLDIRPGIDFWFTPPAGINRKARPWKQWLVTTSVIWPLSMLVPLLMQGLFRQVPPLSGFVVSHLITAGIVVAIVTWIVMPTYVRLVSKWLFA